MSTVIVAFNIRSAKQESINSSCANCQHKS